MSSVIDFEDRLSHADCKSEFIDACRNFYMPDVRIDHAALDRYAESVAVPASINGWSDYVTPGNTIYDDFVELAASTAQQSGYLYEEDGRVKKWQVDGSGDRALQTLMSGVRARNALPGIHLRQPEQVREKLSDIFNSLPYAAQRLQIWQELASQETRDNLTSILADAGVSPERGAPPHYYFGFNEVRRLCDAMPSGFGEDPYMKKAGLLPVLFAGLAHYKIGPDSVSMDIVPPSDYRVPQTLHNMGILRFSDRLVDTLDSRTLLSEDDPFVAQIRAAMIVAVDDVLAARPDLQLFHLDSELWSAGRLFDADPAELDDKKRAMLQQYDASAVGEFPREDFRKRTRQPMNVATMRF